MPNRQMIPWDARPSKVVPTSAKSPNEIVGRACQLRPRDIKQVLTAFELEHYEIATTFVWSKTMTSLRNRLETLGAEFIGEMLQRPDIDEYTELGSAITDSETLALAEDLGMISATECMRLRQAHEVITHFTAMETTEEDDEEVRMTHEEAVACLRACVKNVLGHPALEVAQDFAEFRRELEEASFSADDDKIVTLINAPYFFRKTTLSVLLALLKTCSGAQLDHVGYNTSLIIPLLWPNLRTPERWQAGQVYAELYAGGKKQPLNALKKALVKVSGFDFVPENLRSNTFTRVAKDVLVAHENYDNFYNEPRPMKLLASLGTTVPPPAFSLCMTATLSVWLGNAHGYSFSAIAPARQLLAGLAPDQWTYYLDQCLPTDRRILNKLTLPKTCDRWIELVDEFELADATVENQDVQRLMGATTRKKPRGIGQAARRIYLRAAGK